MESYCVKCKQRRNGINPQGNRAKNGRPVIISTCNSCGSTCSKFVSEKTDERRRIFLVDTKIVWCGDRN